MMETNFTLNIRMVRLLSLIIAGFFSFNQLHAQASCACKGSSINVTLGPGGTHTVTAEEVLASPSSCGGLAGTVTLMTTPNGTPIAGSPVITCAHIGKTLYAKYTNGGNSCWTTINPIEDKMAPTIVCPGNTTLTCVQMANFTPTVADNCPDGLKTIQVGEDVVVNNSCSSTLAPNVIKRITRTYLAEDKSGNRSAPCTFIFDVTTIPSLSDIVIPRNWDIAVGMGDTTALQCDGDWAKLANGHPNPVGAKGTGTPTLGGVNLYNNVDLYCNLMVSYTDTKVQIACVTKIMRSWSILEWSCLNRTIAPRVQLIEIVDDKGPVIVPAADISGSTNNHKCESNVTFAAPNASDNCSTVLTYTITAYANGNYAAPAGFINNGVPSRTLTLPVGNHKAVYAVSDACLNVSRDTIDVIIEDNTPPVAICDEQTTIGLNSNGEAWVPASVIDDGSYDECQLKTLVVRRMSHTACSTCGTPEFPGFALIGERGTGAAKRWYYLSQHTANRKIASKTAVALGGALTIYDNTATTERDAVRGYVQAYSPGITYHVGGNQKDTAPGGSLVASTATDTLRYVIELADPCNAFSTHARFCCSDIGSSPKQIVILRAIDVSGNFNDCMVSVEVQDKIGPSITCPADRTVFCDFSYDPNNLTKDFGWPTAIDNCENPRISIIDSTIALTSCRIGTITRRFLVTDVGGKTASCTQVITFLPDPTKVYNGPTAAQWPAPYMVNGCGTPAQVHPDVTGRPIITDGVCSLVGAQHVDQEFYFNNSSGPACFKILRTWTVIDWCKFAPNRRPNNQLYPTTKVEGDNTWTYVQEIKVVDNVAPVFAPLAAAVSANTTDATCAKGSITLSAKAKDSCSKVLNARIAIDSLNNGSIDKNMTMTPVIDALDSNSVSIVLNYPVGTHKIIFTFEDKCGNLTTREQLFSIVNNKAPNAIVIQGLAVSMMNLGNNVGMADVWAKDFDPDRKSNHPCGYTIYYSFTPVTQVVAGVPVVTPNKVFNCGDRGDNEVIIYVVAISPAGDILQSSVETYVDVQDNGNPKICLGGTRVAVSGTLSTETNQTVKDVRVTLVGSELHAMTSSTGKFDFKDMPVGGNYQVVPEKNDNPINGVSTLDLIMIQRHILGIEKINTPYKLIAADATKDGNITAADLVEIRKLVLGTINNFANNKSWRFVDKAYRFVDNASAQGEAFPEIYSIDKLNANMVTDFVAIKTGDINGNVQASNLDQNVEVRSSKSLVLSTTNQKFVQGQQVVIPIKVSDVTEFNGLQMTLAFDNSALSLTSIDPASMNVNDANFGLTKTGEGILTFSWNDSKPLQLKSGATLFNLTFVAKDASDLGKSLSVNSTFTTAEAYTSDNSVMKVLFNVENRDNSITNFDLKQNTPNPFKESTIIGFEIPSDMQVSISVHDISGKLLSTKNIAAAKGYNTVEFNKSELVSGVIYYSIRAGEFNATKKMVLIE